MADARDKNTLEYIDAEDLWHINPVDKNGYICIGCNLQAIPCSFHKDKNFVRPYFKFLSEHEESCFHVKDEKLVKVGKTKSISTKENGFPLPHPSLLTLKNDDEKKEKQDNVNGAMSVCKTKYVNNGGEKTSSTTHNYSVNTISSIAKHYLKFPYDRKYMSLKIENINGGNYDEVIQKLPNEIVKFKETKLRYGFLNNYKPMKEENSQLTIFMLNGNWIDSKPNEMYEVQIDISTWKPSKIDYIKNIVELSQTKFKEDKKRTYIFFIGGQDDNLNKFIVNDYRLFTVLPEQ